MTKKQMTQSEYIEHIEALYIEALDLVKKKNNDYATKSDPFKNFKNSLLIGVPIEKGIMVRILDKITRISHLLEKEPDVVEESIRDSILDCCNYLCILQTYLSQQKTLDKSDLM